MSPPRPAGRSQDRPPGSAQRGPKQRTTPRAQLQQRAGFAEISPEVGVLDEDAFAEAVAADPDNALTLLVDLGVATDEKLRAAARSLARRRAPSGPPATTPCCRSTARSGSSAPWTASSAPRPSSTRSSACAATG